MITPLASMLVLAQVGATDPVRTSLPVLTSPDIQERLSTYDVAELGFVVGMMEFPRIGFEVGFYWSPREHEFGYLPTLNRIPIDPVAESAWRLSPDRVRLIEHDRKAWISDITPDLRTVVGAPNDGVSMRPAKWAGSEPEFLTGPEGAHVWGHARSVSDDGATIVGRLDLDPDESGIDYGACVGYAWCANNGDRVLPKASDAPVRLLSTSSDGGFIVGHNVGAPLDDAFAEERSIASLTNVVSGEGYIVTLPAMETEFFTWHYATSVSDDGRVVGVAVRHAYGLELGMPEAYVWTPSRGYVRLSGADDLFIPRGMTPDGDALLANQDGFTSTIVDFGVLDRGPAEDLDLDNDVDLDDLRLFALAFGRYSAVERDSRNGVKVAVWTPPRQCANVMTIG